METDQLAGVQRLIVGGKPGIPVGSRLFAASVTTTSGKLGPRAEANLDENDHAIDLLQYGDRALRNGNYRSAATFYTQAVATNQRSVDAHLRLAESLIEQGEFAQAEHESNLYLVRWCFRASMRMCWQVQINDTLCDVLVRYYIISSEHHITYEDHQGCLSVDWDGTEAGRISGWSICPPRKPT